MNSRLTSTRNNAFSLVELSIVLVILGLLTGGILAGQSLIRAAELRAVSSEYSRYLTAASTFRDKYFAVPGDFRDATKFWLLQSGATDCVTNSGAAASATGACDGDGNGLLSDGSAGAVASEKMQFWRQLALAGLIEGTYSGLTGAAGNGDCPLGTSCPRSRLGNAGWITRGIGYFSGDANRYRADYGNYLQFGGYAPNAELGAPQLRAEEAWNLDTKIDDGKPGTGKMITRYWATCSTSTTFTDYAGEYRLDTTALNCIPMFLRSF